MNSTVAAIALGAMGQETRLDIVRMLVQAGPEGLPAGQIGDTLNVAAPVLTYHLTHLRHAGLVSGRRRGRSQIYAARFETLAALTAYLTENCCGGACGSVSEQRCAQ